MKKAGYYILQLSDDERPINDSFVQLVTDPATREPIETWDHAVTQAASLARELNWRFYQIVQIKMTASLDWVVDVVE